ncbi:MAG: hypothetical protein HXY49_03070 [Ignavibacteriaceae bacterium]|nr:hypothetical protein [Ignavibacteriaceae bacterium]
MKNRILIIILAFFFSTTLWVLISLSDEYYTTIEVPLRILNFPQGYTTGTKFPETVSIKVKGKGWKLIRTSLVSDSKFFVSADKDSGKKFINLYNYLSENPWLASEYQIIDISPDTLTFMVEKVSSKKVAVKPNLNLEFKPEYGLASDIIIVPDSVYINGPLRELINIDSVLTEVVELKQLDSRYSETVELKKLRGISFNQNQVSITLDIQRIVDRIIESLNVEIRDVPADREVVLLPNQVDITLRGGIEILGKLNESEVEAFLQYSDIVTDTIGSLQPRIEVPKNVKVENFKPERLRYIIKKFE